MSKSDDFDVDVFLRTESNTLQQDTEIKRVLDIAQRALNIGIRRNIINVEDKSLNSIDIVDAVLGTDETNKKIKSHGKIIDLADLAPIIDHISVLELDKDPNTKSKNEWMKSIQRCIEEIEKKKSESSTNKINLVEIGEQFLLPKNKITKIYRRKALILHPDKISQSIKDDNDIKGKLRLKSARIAFELITLSKDILSGDHDIKDENNNDADSSSLLEDAINGSKSKQQNESIEEQLRKVPRIRIIRTIIESYNSVINQVINKEKPLLDIKTKKVLRLGVDNDQIVAHITTRTLLELIDIHQRRCILVKNLLLQKQRKEEQKLINKSNISGYIGQSSTQQSIHNKNLSELEQEREDRINNWRSYNKTGSNNNNNEKNDLKRQNIKNSDSMSNEPKKKKKKNKVNDDPLGIYS